jgi:tetratricopeptide (TPR) repeat protein
MPCGGGKGNPDFLLRNPARFHHTRRMRLNAVFVALFLALAVSPAPADQTASAKTASSLDRLFGALHATTDPTEANRLTGLIWLIWNHAEDPDTDRLLTEGRKAMEQLEFDAALVCFDKVVAREPKFAEGWNKRATLYYVMGRYRESISDISHVLELEPRHFGALAGLGMNHEALGDDRRALNAWRRALKANPHLEDAQIRVKALETSLRNQPI